MKRKNKFNIAVLLKTVVVLLVLSAMLLSAMLGVTKAEYFKSFKKKLDLEAMPDLVFEYYLVDANPKGEISGNHGSDTYYEKNGVYKNAESILQHIAVGGKDSHKKTINGNSYFFGDDIVYQIKIPVTETGYYTLDFTVDFLFGVNNEPYQSDLNQYGFNDKGLHDTTSYHRMLCA